MVAEGLGAAAPEGAGPWLPPTFPASPGGRPRARRFLALPADEIEDLRGILGLYLSTPRAEEVLRLLGRRLGRSLAGCDPEAPDVAAEVCRLGAQLGLARLTARPSECGASSWTLRMERIAEAPPEGRASGPPVFTAGFLEGLFEGILGGRVRGTLRSRSAGAWELEVETVPDHGPGAGGARLFQPLAARSYRVEVAPPEEFFDRLTPLVSPGSTLVLTREPPARLRAEFGWEGAEVHWFAATHHPGEPTLSTRQLGHVVEVVEAFLQRQTSPALIVWQGLDYLFTRNDPETVLRLVDVIAERTTAAGSSLVVEMAPGCFRDRHARRLRRLLPYRLPPARA